jgi:hypothetical protein
MPAKITRLATLPPFCIPEVSVAVRSSRPSCSKAEKREYSWQIGSHPGNPGSSQIDAGRRVSGTAGTASAFLFGAGGGPYSRQFCPLRCRARVVKMSKGLHVERDYSLQPVYPTTDGYGFNVFGKRFKRLVHFSYVTEEEAMEAWSMVNLAARQALPIVSFCDPAKPWGGRAKGAAP